MLRLENIKKTYVTGEMKVEALKGVSLSFRSHEFVSILGPSGCGKTTLLNIIGGLDHYSDGELFIDGVSTKNYTDRDWDNYRNHRIGFVFQSYNLIPHQTISENVELALAISGIEKKERVIRAHEALDKVGLKGLYDKKPNQLSGGQCQRVAIARALVNKPEILLADEPTGALDTETSIQIMDLIKELSNECLIIMVTHNPELAEKYSSRIIRLLDGKVVGDTLPYVEEKEQAPVKVIDAKRKAKLSLKSTFKLSGRNLISKMKRTVLVSVAGAIGIIGVASVLSVSTGVRNYIADMQNDMLSGNPITISEETIDMNSLMNRTSDQGKKDALKEGYEDGYININKTVDYLISQFASSDLLAKNDLNEDYCAYVENLPQEYYASLSKYYGLNIKNNLYTHIPFKGYSDDEMISLGASLGVYGGILEDAGLADYSSFIGALSSSFTPLIDDDDFILSQYDLLYGNQIGKDAGDLILVLNNDYELNDTLLAELGFYSQDEFMNQVYKATLDKRYDSSLNRDHFSFEELASKSFFYYPNDVIFNETPSSSPLASVNPFTYNAYAEASWGQGKELKITTILRLKDDVSYGSLSSGFYFTSALEKEIMEDAKNSSIVNYLITNEKDGFSSVNYNGNNIGITYNYHYNYNGVEQNKVGLAGETSTSSMLSSVLGDGNSIYTLTLRDLGGNDKPSVIKIYPKDFSYKDKITSYLNEWNSDNDIVLNGKTLHSYDRNEVVFSDNLALVISLVNNMIDMVTAALVAFTCLSLVVSTVMIAIITYVSVIERVKEIGVIRSLGGRKQDVSRLFNVETFLIGLGSGVIGVAFTYLLSFLINLTVNAISGISTIATLNASTALLMILISVLLTMIAGFIPAKIAAKKDPVEALRSE